MSIDISSKHMKLGIHVDITHMEGTMSQIFNEGVDFYFMKSRKNISKKQQKVSCFLT